MHILYEPPLTPPLNPPFTIRIVPQDWRFETTGTQTVLAAFDGAGMRVPSSCRNGTCRTCLCRMVSGQIHYRIEWPGVSPDENRDGYILPCVAVADGDLVLEVRAVMLQSG